MNKLNFKISSSLKNLIGKELITNEFVAIFELVKNSYDANATEVEIKFLNIKNTQNSMLIISDNGRGMSLEDLKNKWLFVGYSAKRDGTEDRDYRQKLKVKRVFAGAKGVGRFSCDRLASYLKLLTRKDFDEVQRLEINWDDFEKDQSEEFINIEVLNTTESLKIWQKYQKENGTVLILSNLRDEWDREKLLKLRKSLEKLINPIQADGDESGFRIKLNVPDEMDTDKRSRDKDPKVNGYIENFIFEKISLKTTSIKVSINSEGELIQTELFDRGDHIYSVIERNPYKLLQNISISLFQLNREAKLNFTKLMGLQPRLFGSVFVYKNGFRVFPYGEPGDDSLHIDTRKQQGYNRFLGTRDLIGRIEITGDAPELMESTSRDGGFIQTDAYQQLVTCFMRFALKRLEAYAVDVIKWGDPRDNGAKGALRPEDVKIEILNIIERLTESADFVKLNYSPSFLQNYREAQSRSVYGEVAELLKNAELQGDLSLAGVLQKHKQRVKELISAKQEAEIETNIARKKTEKLVKELESKSKQVLFLQSLESIDIDRVVKYQHDIGVHASVVKQWLEYVRPKYIVGNIDKHELLQFIEATTISIEKILTITHFVTKANFNLAGQLIKADIIQYIKQYMEVVVSDLYSELNIRCLVNSEPYVTTFRPLEVSLFLDNVASNSYRANARNIIVKFVRQNAQLVIEITDDGKGWSEQILDLQSVFEKGVSTTSGSGLGLFNAKKMVEDDLKGKLLAKKGPKGEFILVLLLGAKK